MALNVFISNDPEKLVLKLIERSDITKKDFFTRSNIVVQTSGLSRWLSVQMAVKSGIFTNFHFTTPNSLIRELFSLANIHLPEIYETNNLKWLIFQVLSNSDFISEFPDISDYYKGDKIKQLQLATRLSDLYDQYSFFRPDYILNWNKDTDNKISKKYYFHEQWQKWIWKKIKDIISEQVSDRVEMFDQFLNSLSNDENLKKRINQKYARFSVFGFSSISQLHINAFIEMSKYTSDIDFYLFNPAPEVYWYHDIPEKTKLQIERSWKNNFAGLNLITGNRLLMDLGKTARYFYLMIFGNEEFINNLDNESLVTIPDRSTLLKWIHNEIYFNIADKDREPIPQEIINDGSVIVTSHHTPGREVEVLYNYLLDILKDPGVKPRDIIVQTPNIDKYVPYIKSVFENAKYKIPYNIADRSFHGYDNPVGILEMILTLREDEFTSEQIFRLLGFKPLREKFDIQDLEMIRILIEKANIRTGIYGRSEDETYIVSWKNGLERIILGFAVYTDELIEINGMDHKNLPLNFIENEFAEAGLKLTGFVNLLIENIKERKTNRSLSQWKEYVQSILNDFFIFDQNDTDQLNYISEKLSFPAIIDTFSGNDISFEIFTSAFFESIYEDKRKGSFYSGNVTFCSMVPMRSIPFRIVAVLGLDFNTFPRKHNEILFDLMNARHRPGDRNNKEADKFLFLETVLSAREKLYLSYLGQDSRNNKEKPASSVLDSLIDYIYYFESDQSKKKNFIIRHPLHNFSSKYFDPEFPRLHTYNTVRSSVGDDFFTSDKKSSDQNAVSELIINDLVSFYKNSVEWYYRRVLKIDFRENNILIPERELLELDNLLEYNLNSQLMLLNEEDDLEEFILKEKIKGNLPLKSTGTIVINKLLDDLKEIKKEFIVLKNGKTPIDIDFEIELSNNYFLKGNIGNIYHNRLILFSPGKNHGKNIVLLQIQRLILSVVNPEISEYILLSRKNDKIEKLVFNPVEKEQAFEILNFLIKTFRYYEHDILVYTADAGLEMTKAAGNARVRKTPEEKFVDTLKEKAKYDDYLHKYLESTEDEEIIELLNRPDHPVIKLNEIFFSYEN
ncbi:MAG: exodeoxyribonuclease V subunit gamma [Deltaproteobacteria bacterium]